MDMIKKLLKKVCRPRVPAEGKPKHVTPTVAGATINLCLTTLVRDPRLPAWMQYNLKAAAWSEALASGPMNLVRDRAARLYNAMDAGGAVCPNVTLFEGSVKIEYLSDAAEPGDKTPGPPRVAVFLLDPGRTRFGTGTRGTPYNLVGGEPADDLVARMGRWVAEGVPL